MIHLSQIESVPDQARRKVKFGSGTRTSESNVLKISKIKTLSTRHLSMLMICIAAPA